jgi:hypothetical protein
MAEEIFATPGWVEQQFDEICSSSYLPVTKAVIAGRDAYLACLARCVIGSDQEMGHDNCRQDFMASLRQARIAPDTLQSLETELEELEADITDTT